MQEDDEDIDDQDDQELEQIIPNLKPPMVPEEGTYITALNEAGID
jgi:hypothetical protein